MKKRIISWILQAALLFGLAIPAMAAETAEIGHLDFDENLIWETDGGLADTSGIQTKDGESFLQIVRDENSGRSASFRVETKLRNAERLSRLRLAYRFGSGGWFQMNVSLQNANGNTLASQRIGGDANWVDASTNFTVAELEVQPSAGDIAYIKFDINGYNASTTLTQACRLIEFSSLTYYGEEEKSYREDESGIIYPFDANGKADGFWFEEGMTLLNEPDGILKTEIQTPGAGMYTQPGSIRIDAKQFSNLMLRYQNETPSELLKIYFTTDTISNYTEDACFLISVLPNQKKMNQYFVNTISNPNWKGTVTGFNIVPAQAAGTVAYDEFAILHYPFTVTDEPEKITITGQKSEFSNQLISLQVLKAGIKTITPENPEIAWEDEIRADRSGAFSFEIPVAAAEVKDTYFVSVAGESIQFDWNLEHKNPDYEEILMQKLMDYTKNGDTKNLTGLLFENQLYLSELYEEYQDCVTQNADFSWISGAMIAEQQTGDSKAFEESLRRCAAAAGLISSGDPVNYLKKHSEILGFSKLSAWSGYEKESAEMKNQIFKRLSEEKPETISSLQNGFLKSVILVTIEKSMGYEAVQKCVEDNREVIGISTEACSRLKYPGRVYQSLAGKKFSDYDALKRAYQEAVEAQRKSENQSSTTGGGGGGGSSSSSGVPSVISPTVLPDSKPEQTEVFRDIHSVSWAKDSILKLYEQNIISGKEEGKFFPNDEITREEFVKLVVCAFSIEQRKTDRFYDVLEDAWYAPFVGGAAYAGIVSGLESDRFGVGENITRQDIAVMLCRAGGLADAETAAELSDWESISDYAKGSVAALYQAGIVSGMGDGSFSPNANATRAEAAVMLSKLMDRMKGETA